MNDLILGLSVVAVFVFLYFLLYGFRIPEFYHGGKKEELFHEQEKPRVGMTLVSCRHDTQCPNNFVCREGVCLPTLVDTQAMMYDGVPMPKQQPKKSA